VSSRISASFSFGGASDYPGSGFEGSYKFKSSSIKENFAVEELVDWVIERGAGVAAAITLNALIEDAGAEADPDGDLDFLMDQFVSFKLAAGPGEIEAIKLALKRSAGYSLALSVIDGTASVETTKGFRRLVQSCIENENPGPLLTEQVTEYLKEK
jgi:hypothetical protein